jgi:hypothetical protein
MLDLSVEKAKEKLVMAQLFLLIAAFCHFVKSLSSSLTFSLG